MIWLDAQPNETCRAPPHSCQPQGQTEGPFPLQAANSAAFLQISRVLQQQPPPLPPPPAPGHRVCPQHGLPGLLHALPGQRDSMGLLATERTGHGNPRTARQPAQPGCRAHRAHSPPQPAVRMPTNTENLLQVDNHPVSFAENRVPALEAFTI